MDPNLTERQQEFLDFILSSQADKGYFPSLREIAAHFNVSIGTVQTHLDYLKRKGALSWDKGKPRAFSIAKRAIKAVGTALENMVQVPILGQVSAGPGLLAEENVEDTLTLPRNFMRYQSGDVFGLKVKGDSMSGAGINEGDLVLVRIQPDALHGDIVVALLGAEALVKTLYKKDGRVALISENPAYPPREVGLDFRILGKVVNLMRTY
ncbi:MAG: transcriptional repressor LexA [candidate division FCPU426 bacterium]